VTSANSGAIKENGRRFSPYLDPAHFQSTSQPTWPAEQAASWLRSQVLNLADNFKAAITTAA